MGTQSAAQDLVLVLRHYTASGEGSLWTRPTGTTPVADDRHLIHFPCQKT